MLLAEPIWAGGHVAAYTGRTHDRFRTAIKSCKFTLDPTGPSTQTVLQSTAPPLDDLLSQLYGIRTIGSPGLRIVSIKLAAAQMEADSPFQRLMGIRPC